MEPLNIQHEASCERFFRQMRQKFEGILCVLPRVFVKYYGNNRRRFDRKEFLEVTITTKTTDGDIMKLLYAEDEYSMSEAVTDILTYHKYSVDAVYDGQEALEYAMVEQYDGIILDIMMPKKNGLEVLKELRNKGIKTPVLLLTAKGEVEDRIEGLDLGADDYLPKPFNMGELLARVRAMLRRREDFTPDILKVGNITLNMQNYSLSNGKDTYVLPNLEYKMMELLMLNKGKYLSTEDMLVKVWGYDTEADIGIVWVYISYLRKRLTALNATCEIKAKRNIGYTLEVVSDD